MLRLLSRFEVRTALKYLWSSPLQTGLVVTGVAVGIMVATFMAALMNGLNDDLVEKVLGNLPHVMLEAAERTPEGQLEVALGMGFAGGRSAGEPGARPLVAVQRSSDPPVGIAAWRQLLPLIESEPGVVAVAPVAIGDGFARRGGRALPVTVFGSLPERVSAIVQIEGHLVGGEAGLRPGDILVGIRLAEELGLEAGQYITIQSSRGHERALRVRGIFDVGSGDVNERVAYVELATAQALWNLGGNITRIDLKVSDVFGAPAVAERLGNLTGLRERDWVEGNKRIQDAISGQASTARVVRSFSMMAVVVAIASVLLVVAVRRNAEIGIMRSVGVSKGSVAAIFILQGTLLGLFGSVTGALAGWGLSTLLRALTLRPDGTALLPADPARGEYLSAIVVATMAAAIAALIPARTAARVDPVEVIEQ